MSRQAPYPESPYHRIYTKNRSFSQLRPGPAAKNDHFHIWSSFQEVFYPKGSPPRGAVTESD